MEKHTDVERIVSKEIYTDEEKALIMQRLDAQRRASQRKAQQADTSQKRSGFDDEEKKRILERLNENRLTQQRYAQIKVQRTEDKQIYRFGSKRYYKLLGMEREYYIPVEECEKISGKPRIVALYYQTLDALQQKDVLMKTESFSKGFHISQDVLRVYYKMYELENKRK